MASAAIPTKVWQLLMHWHWKNIVAPKVTYIHSFTIAVKFEGNYLKQDKISFTHRNVIHFFIVFELGTYSYSGYKLDSIPDHFFQFHILIFGKNVFIFGVKNCFISTY